MMKRKVWIRLTVETGCEELVQPRGENNGSHVIFQNNLFKYFGVFPPDAKSVGCKTLVKG